jgi:hypothetical protein
VFPPRTPRWAQATPRTHCGTCGLSTVNVESRKADRICNGQSNKLTAHLLIEKSGMLDILHPETEQYSELTDEVSVFRDAYSGISRYQSFIYVLSMYQEPTRVAPARYSTYVMG